MKNLCIFSGVLVDVGFGFGFGFGVTGGGA
jgi:hypothetical protein